MQKQCGNCIFWDKVTFNKNVPNDGLCFEIKEKIYIDVQGDGFLNYIETEEDFCCSLHQFKS